MSGTAYTLAEASELLGVSLKAVRSRVERGSLPCVKGPDGLRRIPAAALPGHTARQEVPREAAIGETGSEPATDLIERLERLASENGRLKALTEAAESVEQRLADELSRARAELLAAQLQLAEVQAANAGRWFRRKRKAAEASLTDAQTTTA